MMASIITENELYKLHRGFKKWYGLVTTYKEINFVDFYKKNVKPVFSVDDNLDLELWTFKINLNYFNIYGLELSGRVTNKDNEDATITLNLSKTAIDKKLSNWGKIIIQFIKYTRGVTLYRRMVELRFPNKTFKKVSEQNQKMVLKVSLLFW